jgi:pimeloyl-ACP methyl ester carboxylesterase
MLISKVESKRNVLSQHLRILKEKQSTLHHVETEEENEQNNNMENGGNSEGEGGGDSDGENDSSAASTHWLIKVCTSIKDLYVSWQAARTPLDTVINMAYLRYELLERYNAVEGWAGGDVDSVYFPPRGSSASSSAAAPTAAAGEEERPIAPTKIVIMCFPNAGILEFVHYQSDWLPFYLSQGFAVVMTNYRGYGLTRNGLPSPSAVKRDGGIVVDQLVALYPSARIMVHGESMGGMVACALASKHPLHVSLAYVDRTFADLPKVGSTLLKLDFVAKYGPWILPWKTNNVDDWLSITCPKMCANDPNDTMIAETSSLKEGVSEELTERAIEQQSPWATDGQRLLPLWNDEPDDDDENSGKAAEMLLGAWNALKTLLMAQATRDPSLVRTVLRHVHNCDGRQNKTLGTAMTEGPDAVRRWSRTLLVWGPVAVVPDSNVVKSELMHRTKIHLQQRGMSAQEAVRVAYQSVGLNMPVPLEEVYRKVQEAILTGAAGVQGKEAMEGLGQVVADLHFGFRARVEGLKHADAVEMRAQLGRFLPLRCGHNNALKQDEMLHVKEFLTEHGWLQ